MEPLVVVIELRIVLYADTTSKQSLGLMHRRPIAADECAVFEFEELGQYGFWNKNVQFPVAVFLCDKELLVRDTIMLAPFQEEIVVSKWPKVAFAIEVSQAHFDGAQSNLPVNRFVLSDDLKTVKLIHGINPG